MDVFGLSRVCHENYPFEEVNDTNQFEARFLGGTIEWEKIAFKNPVITSINQFYVRHIQNSGQVIAVLLGDKIYCAFTWVLRCSYSPFLKRNRTKSVFSTIGIVI